MIKEFEASHGTVTDLYEAHLRGEETSMNPLGMVEALIGAMQHASVLQMEAGTGDKVNHQDVMDFTTGKAVVVVLVALSIRSSAGGGGGGCGGLW